MKLLACVCLTMAALLISGCNGDSIATVPAAGTVTLNGEPLTDADVIFRSEAGVSASGRTDAQGKFTLNTYDATGAQKPGAPVGDYSVTVAKVKTSGAASPEDMMKQMAAAKKPGEADVAPENVLPDTYASPKSSGLKASVKAGDPNEFKFELKGN